MFILSLVYMGFLVWYAIQESKKASFEGIDAPHEVTEMTEENEQGGFAGWYEKMKGFTWFLVTITFVGLALVVVGALLGVIPAAKVIASELGVPENVIGLTVVAVGTSLPELVTCVVAAKKGETDIIPAGNTAPGCVVP